MFSVFLKIFLTFKKTQNITTALFSGFATLDFLLGGTQLSLGTSSLLNPSHLFEVTYSGDNRGRLNIGKIFLWLRL